MAFLVGRARGGAPPELVGGTGLDGTTSGAPCCATRCIACAARARRPRPGSPVGHRPAGPGCAGWPSSRSPSRPAATAPSSVSRAVYDQAFDEAEVALLRRRDASARPRARALLARRRAAERAPDSRPRWPGPRRSLGRVAATRARCSTRCAREVARALGADVVMVYFGDAATGLIAVASHGAGRDFIGFRREPGEGLCGQAVRTGRPQVSNAYVEEGRAPGRPRLPCAACARRPGRARCAGTTRSTARCRSVRGPSAG